MLTDGALPLARAPADEFPVIADIGELPNAHLRSPVGLGFGACGNPSQLGCGGSTILAATWAPIGRIAVG
jgi:hypothetical protein